MSTADKTGVQRRRSSATSVLVELVRLGVVVLFLSLAFELATSQALDGVVDESENLTLLVIVLGAGLGYVTGGVIGRFSVGRIDAAERSLRSLSAGELLAGALGGLAALLLAAAITWPVLLFDGKRITIPLAALVMILLAATGLRVGVARGGDLLRYLGASGRLAVSSPTTGARAKVVDTSALIDGRILDVCRAGFLEGTLVIPRFVLYELQGIADQSDQDRRLRGRRGLDVLAALQRSGGIAVEVTDRDYPDLDAVDAKLVAMAKARKATLVTVDSNLADVAEVQGVKVLNLHVLAETLRPPVLPGDRLRVRVVKVGKEARQGVGYLEDGTMVVVENGRDHVGAEVDTEVTSILSNPHGRMVFATAVESPSTLRPADRGSGGMA